MKKILLSTLVAAAVSCSSDIENVAPVPQNGTVHVCMQGMDISTRASLVASEKALTDLYILDVVAGTPVRVLHQSSSDADFAEPTLSLPYGSHTLMCYASRSTSPALADADGPISVPSSTLTLLSSVPTLWTSTKVSDTFMGSADVTVQAGTTASCEVQLNRIVAQMAITISDQIPANAQKLQLTFSHYADRCALLTAAASPSTNMREIDLTPARGNTNQRVAVFTLTPDADLYHTDISVQILSSDSKTLSSFDLTDVPLQRNHTTTISGSFFGHTKGLTFTVNDTWDEEIEYNF